MQIEKFHKSAVHCGAAWVQDRMLERLQYLTVHLTEEKKTLSTSKNTYRILK